MESQGQVQVQEDFNQYFKLKRDQYLIEIRKGKNSKFLAAKRLKFTESNSENEKIDQTPNLSDPFEVQEYANKLVSELVGAIEAQDYNLVTESAEKIRRMISIDDNPPLEPLLKTNIAPTLVSFICPDNYRFEKLILEFSWILANIASGDGFYVQYLVDLEAIPKALDLLQYGTLATKENAITLLANIAGENTDYRDHLLQRGIVNMIEYVYSTYIEGSSLTFPSEFAWFLSVLTRGSPYPDFDQMTPILISITDLLQKYQSKDVMKWVLRTFSNFADGGNNQIQKIFDFNCVEPIISFLNPKYITDIRVASLRALGNLSTGTNAHVEALMKFNVLEPLAALLRDPAKAVRKEAAWALANIIAAGDKMIAAVFEYQDGWFLDRLFKMIEKEDFRISKECTYCLTNICLAGTFDQIAELVERDFVELLSDSIRQNTETKFLIACLEALDAILTEYKRQEELLEISSETILKRLASCGGYDVVEDLQNHQDNEVYSIVSKLIQAHFDFA